MSDRQVTHPSTGCPRQKCRPCGTCRTQRPCLPGLSASWPCTWGGQGLTYHHKKTAKDSRCFSMVTWDHIYIVIDQGTALLCRNLRSSHEGLEAGIGVSPSFAAKSHKSVSSCWQSGKANMHCHGTCLFLYKTLIFIYLLYSMHIMIHVPCTNDFQNQMQWNWHQPAQYNPASCSWALEVSATSPFSAACLSAWSLAFMRSIPSKAPLSISTGVSTWFGDWHGRYVMGSWGCIIDSIEGDHGYISLSNMMIWYIL